MLNASAVSLNAAGIADSFRCWQLNDHDGDSRLSLHLNRRDGWIGVIGAIAAAADAMECFRASLSLASKWGYDLPSIYIAWEAVGRALWESDDLCSAEQVTVDALEKLKNSHAEWHDDEFGP